MQASGLRRRSGIHRDESICGARIESEVGVEYVIAVLAVVVVAAVAAIALRPVVVIATVHDYQRGPVIGQKTFGKGSVQEDFPLPDGSDLHLTVERWYGPNGESIDVSGITPDRVAALTSRDNRFRLDAEGPDAAVDTQLQAALAAVRP